MRSLHFAGIAGESSPQSAPRTVTPITTRRNGSSGPACAVCGMRVRRTCAISIFQAPVMARRRARRGMRDGGWPSSDKLPADSGPTAAVVRDWLCKRMEEQPGSEAEKSSKDGRRGDEQRGKS